MALSKLSKIGSVAREWSSEALASFAAPPSEFASRDHTFGSDVGYLDFLPAAGHLLIILEWVIHLQGARFVCVVGIRLAEGNSIDNMFVDL